MSDAIVLSIMATGEAASLQGHSNALPFEGCLTLLDTASDRSPSGARGHRVRISSEVAAKCLPSLLGMSINFGNSSVTGHDVRNKCGIITQAEIVDRKILIRGYIYKRDFPELQLKLSDGEWGMSYELADSHVTDMRSAVWDITKFEFTGAAIAPKNSVAYRNTWFKLNSPVSAPVADTTAEGGKDE